VDPQLIQLAVELLPEALVTLVIGIAIVQAARAQRAPPDRSEECRKMIAELAELSAAMHRAHQDTRQVVRDLIRSRAG